MSYFKSFKTEINFTLNDSDIIDEINALNDQYAMLGLGALIFLGFCILAGVIGNIHVLYIYSIQACKSTNLTFVKYLACVDLLACIVGMPTVLLEMRYPIMIYDEWICKFGRFCNHFLSLSSSLILLVIAINRYMKICKPLKKQITESMIKIFRAIIVFLSLSTAWPSAVLYGENTITINIDRVNIICARCFIDDKYAKSDYLAYFNGVILMGVIVESLVMSVLYSLIARRIWLMDRYDTSQKTIKTRTAGHTTQDHFHDSRNLSALHKSESKPQTDHKNETTGKLPKITNDRQGRYRRHTTLMLFTVNVVFVIFYLPVLICNQYMYTTRTNLDVLEVNGYHLYNVLICVFFANNVINPLIYGFCDRRFRSKLKSMYFSSRKGGDE